MTLLVGSIFHMTRKIVSEMTYNVSMGTLNPTIPIHTYVTINTVACQCDASITTLWPVPNYTSCWQRHVWVNNLPGVVTWKWNGQESNCVLLITEPQLKLNLVYFEHTKNAYGQLRQKSGANSMYVTPLQKLLRTPSKFTPLLAKLS